MKIGFLGVHNIICGISEHLRYSLYYGLTKEERKNSIVFAGNYGERIRPDEDFVRRCWYRDNFYEFLNYTIKENPVDIINIQHEYGLQNTEFLVKAIKKLQQMGIKVVTTFHTSSHGEDMSTNPIYNVSDWSIVHTESIGDMLTSIPVPFLDFDIDHLANRVKFDSNYKTKGKFLIGHFGFPYSHKGHKEIIDAVKDIPNAVLVFLFSQRKELNANVPCIKDYADQVGCPNIIIHKFFEIEKVIELLSACDVAIFNHPKDTPGNSGAIRIGMGAKIPIITSPAGVIKDALPLLNVSEPENFKDELIKAKGSKIRYLDYIKNNSWKTMMNQYKEIFERLVV